MWQTGETSLAFLGCNCSYYSTTYSINAMLASQNKLYTLLHFMCMRASLAEKNIQQPGFAGGHPPNY